MSNPFKFGSVVDKDFFTDRKFETEELRSILSSKNHLILISPRRFGKTSLIKKATQNIKRPIIYFDLQSATDISDFAAQLLKIVLKNYKWENLKQLISQFRIVPTVEINPTSDSMEISFQATTKNKFTQLEDVLNLIEKLGTQNHKPIVIFDEFQEIILLGKNLPKQLRAVIQHHENINYVFLGSLESMMKTIFEDKKSPFYHFGHLMYLHKIPYEDFLEYLQSRFSKITTNSIELSAKILEFTQQHPYYTQQLAFYCWDFLEKHKPNAKILEEVISNIISIYDFNYEKLWNTINKTDKKILITIALQKNISTILLPLSTIYSGINRLINKGYIFKTEKYEIDDPFFNQWIIQKRNE